MEFRNETFITYFILIGFSTNFQMCIILFFVFFFIFLLILLGNSIFIIIVVVSPQLHTPMYYFICNLSFIDLCYSICVFPKMLTDFLSEERRISLLGCLIQMNIFAFLAGMEGLLLTVMAYDRYIAICLPLYYTTIMNWFLCKCLNVTMMVTCFIMGPAPLLLRPFVFCKKRNVDHFACEFLGLLHLACGDLFFYKLHVILVMCFMFVPLSFIVVSYVCIITSILKIHSSDGRSKAFSTCSSHLTVVVMFFGTIIITYIGQAQSSSSNLKYIALIYGVITPILNPLIYSLRNNEFKKACRKLFFTLSVHFTDSRHYPTLTQ